MHDFDTLAVRCDSSHQHEVWGLIGERGKQTFATAQEAAYPKALCKKFSDALKLRARSLGWIIDCVNIPVDTSARIAAQQQPRKKPVPPIISEYDFTQTILLPPDISLPLNEKHCLTHSFHAVPAGSKLLRQSKVQGKSGSEGKTVFTFGIFRSEIAFVNEAKNLIHPFDSCCSLSDHMLRAIAFMLKEGPLAVMKYRLTMVQKWRQYANDLAEQEAALHRSLPAGVAKVLAGKNLLLLEKIATDLGWDDTRIHQDIREGFLLTGNPMPSGISEPVFRPAAFEVDELWRRQNLSSQLCWLRF